MVFVSCEAIDRSEWRMIDHVIWNYRVELISKTVWAFVDSHHFSETDFKEVVEYSPIVRSSDSCEWRCGEISYWTVFGEELPVIIPTFFRRRWKRFKLIVSLDVCSRQRSPQDGNMWTGGSRRRRRDLWKTADRNQIDNMERIFARWLSLAYWSIHRLRALLMARA